MAEAHKRAHNRPQSRVRARTPGMAAKGAEHVSGGVDKLKPRVLPTIAPSKVRFGNSAFGIFRLAMTRASPISGRPQRTELAASCAEEF